jgi:CRISPR-associated protein Cmr6
MNLKHFYYRGYFDGRIKLAQPDKNTDARKKNEEVNEKAFRLKNATLTSTERVVAFTPSSIQKIAVQELQLQVQNPGLLPGIGYPHEVGYLGEFKLGFGFDHITGLPVLPGSSVKGVLRSVFPQFKFDVEHPEVHKNGDDLQVEKAKYIVGLLRRLALEVPADTESAQIKKLAHQLELTIFCGFNFENAEKTTRLPMSKHDVFFDALPIAFKQNQLLGRDALTPHTSGPLKNPIPLPFLKVMPGVTFGFYFRLQDSKIGSLTITTEHKRLIFGEILCTVGAGAKTNVGYGQFEANNAADRVPKPATSSTSIGKVVDKTGAQPENIAKSVPNTPAQVKKLPFSKSLIGKDAIGEVVSGIGENPVRFRIVNVEGFEGERVLKISEALLSKFQNGLKFKLKVSKSNSDRNEFEVSKVSDYTPIS